MGSDRNYEIVGGCFGLGSNRSGTFNAPQALRAAGLLTRLGRLGIQVTDGGDIIGPRSAASVGDPRVRYGEECAAFSVRVRDRLLASYQRGAFPILCGGDHSIAIGSVAAASEHLQLRCGSSGRLGLLWVDAHGDINTPETSPSGMVHGMPVAAALGFGDSKLTAINRARGVLDPARIIYLGVRDLDPPEKLFMRRLGVQVFSMKDIDIHGIGNVCSRIFSYLEQHCDGFLLSLDLDVCDPSVVPGVGTPVRGGLTLRESHLIMELAAEQQKLIGADLVELNPELDPNGTSTEFAIWLIESLLGKSLW